MKSVSIGCVRACLLSVASLDYVVLSAAPLEPPTSQIIRVLLRFRCTFQMGDIVARPEYDKWITFVFRLTAGVIHHDPSSHSTFYLLRLWASFATSTRALPSTVSEPLGNMCFSVGALHPCCCHGRRCCCCCHNFFSRMT